MPDACAQPNSDADDTDDAVVQALLAYLHAHPQAADSLHGVARWWVGQDDGVDIQRVRRALEHLVEAGQVRHERWADGTEWYCGLAQSPARLPPLH